MDLNRDRYSTIPALRLLSALLRLVCSRDKLLRREPVPARATATNRVRSSARHLALRKVCPARSCKADHRAGRRHSDYLLARRRLVILVILATRGIQGCPKLTLLTNNTPATRVSRTRINIKIRIKSRLISEGYNQGCRDTSAAYPTRLTKASLCPLV